MEERRRTCPNPQWVNRSFVEQDRDLPGAGAADIEGRSLGNIWVGRLDRPVGDAAELGCGWHPVNNEVARSGEALLEADTLSGGPSRGCGVDETLFWRQGRWWAKARCTTGVAVGGRRLIDVSN